MELGGYLGAGRDVNGERRNRSVLNGGEKRVAVCEAKVQQAPRRGTGPLVTLTCVFDCCDLQCKVRIH